MTRTKNVPTTATTFSAADEELAATSSCEERQTRDLTEDVFILLHHLKTINDKQEHFFKL